MPKGDEEEIAVRDEEFFRFVALLATRALLERLTLNSSLNRDQPRTDGACCFEQARSNLGAKPREAYIFEFRRGCTSNYPVKHRLHHALRPGSRRLKRRSDATLEIIRSFPRAASARQPLGGRPVGKRNTRSSFRSRYLCPRLEPPSDTAPVPNIRRPSALGNHPCAIGAACARGLRGPDSEAERQRPLHATKTKSSLPALAGLLPQQTQI